MSSKLRLPVYKIDGDKLSKAGEKDLDPSVFDVPFNEGMVHQVVVSIQEQLRCGTHASKNRSAKRGGGAKPWRQKGTGRARAGTRRSPIWRGGGHTFAKTPYDYKNACKINKKMYRKSVHCLLSKLHAESKVSLVEELNFVTPKTKEMLGVIGLMKLNKPLFVVDSLTENLFLSSRNIPNLGVITYHELEPLSLLITNNIVMTNSALESYQKEYAS
ncbi:MAG: 50S ribosomal protein L4 [Pseudomonadota bacterium]|nr:50S ribosomal protein L4 [Pseudomonadota bacterium]